MTRWLRLCQECWQERHPNDYLPARSLDFDDCDFCGESALVYGASAGSGPRHEDRMTAMGPDDFHDLGLCPDCERDMTAGELHTAECPAAIAQDHADGDHSGCDHEYGNVTQEPRRGALDSDETLVEPAPEFDEDDGWQEHGGEA